MPEMWGRVAPQTCPHPFHTSIREDEDATLSSILTAAVTHIVAITWVLQLKWEHYFTLMQMAGHRRILLKSSIVH